LCAINHHGLHARGSEPVWWRQRNIDPLPVAEELWAMSRSGKADSAAE
jgi:hypothetical protein